MKINASNIEKDIKEAILKYCDHDNFQGVYEYALLPAGKLFRPRLVWATALDNGTVTDNHKKLATSVEIHHTYTLLHDDLPCMDDDDERRGRPSTHKKFNEWKALLAGDGLLNLSYRLLTKLDHPNALNVLKIYSHMLGTKGLIKGQYLDLSGEMNSSFETLLETHTLKTARLIQTSLVGSYLLTDKPNFKMAKEYFRIGHAIGILFQLFDDLTELVDEKLSKHEDHVNPWPKEYEKCSLEVQFQIEIINKYLKEKIVLHNELTDLL